jgi:hypothetical protein
MTVILSERSESKDLRLFFEREVLNFGAFYRGGWVGFERARLQPCRSKAEMGVRL